MGSENNVLHVEEEEKKDEVEEGENDEVEEGENDEVEDGENDNVEESAEDETDATNCDEEPKVSTEVKEDSVPKPIILTRAGCIEQKLREVEDAVENLMLNSPVRVTRGKLKKVISENDQTPAKC